MYPIEKYKFIEITTKNGCKKVIALSTYAGKTVKGVATCDPRDTFNIETGKKLAAARCEMKVAKRRAQRAIKEYAKAKEIRDVAQKQVNKMSDYLTDSFDNYEATEQNLRSIESSLT